MLVRRGRAKSAVACANHHVQAGRRDSGDINPAIPVEVHEREAPRPVRQRDRHGRGEVTTALVQADRQPTHEHRHHEVLPAVAVQVRLFDEQAVE